MSDSSSKDAAVCNDWGDPLVPGCLREPDPRFTMDFTDVEPGPGGVVHWCSACGPRARAMEAALSEAFVTRPGFAGELGREIERAMAKRRESSS